MSERVLRDFRRQASKVAAQTVKAVAPGIEAALMNEQLTRQRVEALERNAVVLADRFNDLSARPLLGRLRWLFTGK